MASHCFGIPLLRHHIFSRSYCFDNPLLRQPDVSTKCCYFYCITLLNINVESTDLFHDETTRRKLRLSYRRHTTCPTPEMSDTSLLRQIGCKSLTSHLSDISLVRHLTHMTIGTARLKPVGKHNK